MKNIGILTSGGDCGGLNGVVKGTAQMAIARGIKCFVIPNGYAGLYNLVDFGRLTELTLDRLDAFDVNNAGSEAGHSRVKIKKILDDNKYERIREGLKKFSIDGLVISGGDDSGSVMVDLYERGIKCVHAPKTMDLDLQTYSVGGDSTINRITRFAVELKTTGRTHNRVIVMEVFGRYAGHTAFRGGVAADADAIIIPEIPTDFDILYQHCKKTIVRRILASDVYSGMYLVIVAEGLKNADGSEIVDESAGIDSFGHKKLAGAGKYTVDQLTKRFKADAQIKEFMRESKTYVPGMNEIPEIRSIVPTHLVRCGASSSYDVNFGREAGAAAVLLLEKGIVGVTVVGITGNQVRYMKASDAIKQRFVDLNQAAYYEQMGICFGRKPVALVPEFTELAKSPERYM
jgi:6-phosphofructokinase 1